MTRDDDKPQSGHAEDEQVSRSYRDVATERAPRHLDSAVLAQAAGAARPRYARSLAWTKPLAFAATIVLCVTIVLELTRTPQPDGAIAPAERRTDAAPAIEPAPVGEAGATVSAEEPAAPKRERSEDKLRNDAPAAAGAQGPQPAATLDAEAFRPRDIDMLQQARETAKRQSGANPEARPQGLVDRAARSCDADAIATPETWLECIGRLEESGRTAEAENEQRLLEAAFPDFDAR